MFWFAWTGEYNSIHWIVPTIAGVFLSTSILLIFVAYLNYITDTYLMYASSALAANTICRSAAGAAAPLFTQQMFDALGVGWGGSLIGFVAIALAPIPFVFYRYGGKIREKSKFAPTNEGRDSTNHGEKNAVHGSTDDDGDAPQDHDQDARNQSEETQFGKEASHSRSDDGASPV